MILFQDEEKVWDFGSPARSQDLLERLGFSCTRAGTAYCYSNGLFRVAAENSFRYCSAGGRTGLIVEQAQDNLALYSADGNNAAWVADFNITKNEVTSCISGQSACLLINSGGFEGITQVIGTFSDKTCFHIIIEEGAAATYDFGLYDNTAAGYVVRLRYTKATGLVTVVGGFSADNYSVSVINPVGPNGGKLISLSLSHDTSAINGNSLKTFFYLGAGIGTAYFHYAQLTADDVCSSPIVTEGASASRAADVITSAQVPSFINKGSCSVVVQSITANEGLIQTLFFAFDGTFDNLFSITKTMGTDKANISNAGVSFGAESGNALTNNVANIIAGSFTTGSLYSASDGVCSANTVTDGIPQFTAMSIGSAYGLDFFFNGKIFSLKFIPSAISDVGLEDITNA